VYHSRRLVADGWEPHSQNPVVVDRPAAARPGGRPFVADGCVFVYFQDCRRRYGHQVRLYRLESLSRNSYADSPVVDAPVLSPTPRHFGWNAGKMHHIDYYPDGDRWRCLVDGNIGTGRALFGDNWSIGVYDSPRPTSTTEVTRI
jgi:hypothetical protein